ncbi:MAG: putative aminohydrolase SsnA [Bacillota bacterium]|nr:putative aminohydrolase SsnA [Bacillota bacterium]
MLLIENARLLTRDPARPYIEHGALLIDGKLIAAVGDKAELATAPPSAERIDARGRLVMPGLINAHHHIYSALARGMAIDGYAPRGFLDILSGLWWRLDRALGLDDVRISARLNAIDCIKCGVTTIFDHHASYGAVEGSLFVIAEELQAAGLRSALCYELSDRDGAGKAQAAFAENLDFIRHAAADDSDTLYALFGLHASFTLSDGSISRAVQDIPAGVGFHIHVAEGADDLLHAQRFHDCRVVERLHRSGVLGPKTIAAHCIHVDEHELELLKDSDTMIVHNPQSNMGNAVGCPPLPQMLKSGLLAGLGTDGYTADMLESMKAVPLLHKHDSGDCAAANDAAELLLFANNPRIAARYFRTPLGVLQAGAAADVIICDYDPPTPMSAANAGGHLQFGVGGRDVSTTICGGRVLMRERRLTGLDEQETCAKGREQAAALWRRVNA